MLDPDPDEMNADPQPWLVVQVADYSMSRNLGTAHVVTYVPGSKGAPSFCRIYRYPNFEENQAALWNRNRRNRNILTSGTGTGFRFKIMYLISFI